jgi:siroheme synthase
MAVRFIPTISANLLAHGRPPSTPVAIIEYATATSPQRIIMGTLGDIDGATAGSLTSPAVIVIGDAVRLLQYDGAPVHRLGGKEP